MEGLATGIYDHGAVIAECNCGIFNATDKYYIPTLVLGIMNTIIVVLNLEVLYMIFMLLSHKLNIFVAIL